MFTVPQKKTVMSDFNQAVFFLQELIKEYCYYGIRVNHWQAKVLLALPLLL